jgi:hypothetical protein
MGFSTKGVSLVISIVGDIAGLDKSLGDAGDSIKGIGGISLKTAAQVSIVAGVAVAAGDAIWQMTEAADADRTEQMKLARAIDAAGAATATSTQQVEDAITAGQDRAFTDSQTRDALQSLVTATGDVTQATTLLATAQDIARFANVDLATASDAVAKAAAGQDTQLTRMLPGLEKGATATDTLANATKAAAGQADIYANSAEGMKAQAGDAFSELSETIGSVFLPIMDAILPALVPIIKAFGQLVTSILPILVPLITLLGKALKIVADVLVTTVNWVVKLVDWLGKLLSPLKSVLDGLNNLPFGALGKIVGGGGKSAPGVSTFGTEGTAASSGGITFNIYGDPSVIEARVIKALQDYTRRNGSTAINPLAR